MIELYDTFNTKGCTDKLIFGNSNDQPISFNYCNFLNCDNDNGNNIPGNPVECALTDNKVVEDSVVPNDEYINNDIIIHDYDSLDSYIDPPKKKKFF